MQLSQLSVSKQMVPGYQNTHIQRVSVFENITAACLQVVLIITLADRSTNLVNVGFYQLLLINSDSEMERFGCHRADLFLFSI